MSYIATLSLLLLLLLVGGGRKSNYQDNIVSPPSPPVEIPKPEDPEIPNIPDVPAKAVSEPSMTLGVVVAGIGMLLLKRSDRK